MDKPLSNFDLIRIIAKEMGEKANVKDLDQVHRMDDIEQLFEERGHCILFNKNPDCDIGHWNVLLRSPKGALFFDSFGDTMKDESVLDLISQDYDKISENLKKYQNERSSVCGRYCLFCIACNKIFKGCTIDDIERVFAMKPPNETYDEFILRHTT